MFGQRYPPLPSLLGWRAIAAIFNAGVRSVLDSMVNLRRTALALIVSCSLVRLSAQDDKPLSFKSPSYPPLARLARVAGTVTLGFTIDSDGKTASVRSFPDTQSCRRRPKKIFLPGGLKLQPDSWRLILIG